MYNVTNNLILYILLKQSWKSNTAEQYASIVFIIDNNKPFTW